MSGKRGDPSLGQLALMDAVVFFVIALTISCVLMFYSRVEMTGPPQQAQDGRTNPSAILPVFLRASMGREIVLNLDGEVRISGTSDIDECIMSELDALVRGADLGDFKPMNDELMRILEGICGPCTDPYLVAYQLLDSPREVFSIPGKPPDNVSRYASHTELPGFDGSTFLLILILVPASLPEIVEVGASDLDLGLSVGETPPYFHP